jgi:hypothetical protein
MRRDLGMANRPRGAAPFYDDPLTGHLPRQWVTDHVAWNVKRQPPVTNASRSRPPEARRSGWLPWVSLEVWVLLGILAASLYSACITLAGRIASAFNQLNF